MTSAMMAFQQAESLLNGLGAAFGELSPDGPRDIFPEHYRRRDRIERIIEDLAPVRSEIAICRSIDSFLAYISDVLAEALVARPQLLKTQEQVSMEDVLEHDNINSFVSWAAEKRVNQLSFKGLPEISTYIEKRLGLQLVADKSDWQILRQAIAVRNLIVHRRRVVDEIFLRITKEPTLKRGDLYIPTNDEYVRFAKVTMKTVADFDERIAVKFDLGRPNIEGMDYYSPGRWDEDENESSESDASA